VPLSPSMMTVLDTGALSEPFAIENPAHGEIQFVRGDRLGEDIGEAKRAQSIAQLRVFDVGETDDRRPVPQPIADDLEIDRVAEVAGKNDQIWLEALDLAAQIVEWGDDGRLDGIGLEECVEPDGGLDVGERDEDFHRPIYLAS